MVLDLHLSSLLLEPKNTHVRQIRNSKLSVGESVNGYLSFYVALWWTGDRQGVTCLLPMTAGIGSNWPPCPFVQEKVGIEDGQMDEYYHSNKNDSYQRSFSLLAINYSRTWNSSMTDFFFFCCISLLFSLSLHFFLPSSHSASVLLTSSLPLLHFQPLWLFPHLSHTLPLTRVVCEPLILLILLHPPPCPTETLYQLQRSNFVIVGVDAISEQLLIGQICSLSYLSNLPVRLIKSCFYRFIIFTFVCTKYNTTTPVWKCLWTGEKFEMNIRRGEGKKMVVLSNCVAVYAPLLHSL